MAYRDDADAARARAEALEQDLKQTRRELAESDEESDELREKLAKAEKEAKRYRKLADKLERKVEGKPPRGLTSGIVVATVVQAQLDRVSAAMAEYIRVIEHKRDADVKLMARTPFKLIHAYRMAWGAYFNGYLIAEGWYRALKR